MIVSIRPANGARTVYVTYGFIVDVEDGEEVGDAVSEYVRSVSDAFDSPLSVEDITNDDEPPGPLLGTP